MKREKQRLKGSQRAKLPKKFTTRLFIEADGRRTIVKTLGKGLKAVLSHRGADSLQEQMLAEEAIFIGVRLETMRTNAARGREFDEGVYTQMVNCLQGLLTKLGLEKKCQKEVHD